MFITSQKNSLYKAIQEFDLNHRDFDLKASQELKITHRSTGFYFRIHIGEDESGNKRGPLIFTSSTPDYSRAIVQIDKEQRHTSIDKWDTVVHIFRQWLSWIKREGNEPDLWADMEHTPHMFEEEEPLSDDRFTPAEIKQLKERVAEVEQRVIDLNLPPEAEAAITQAIREVPAKAKRFTKKELADTIVGALVKEGFKWGLTTEHMGAAWTAIQHFFTTLIA